MTTFSISEIITEACKLTEPSEQVEYLKKNNSKELRNILILMYDNKFTFAIPSTAPPYTPSVHTESHGHLYREARKLGFFVNELPDGKNLDRVRKEALFIQMLEVVDKDDAIVLLRMIRKEPYAELLAETINEAFDGIISDPVPATPLKKKRGRPFKVEPSQDVWETNIV